MLNIYILKRNTNTIGAKQITVNLNINYKTTLDLDYIASSITSFHIGNRYYMLDIGALIEKLKENDVDVTKYTEGHCIPVGYVKGANKITPIELTGDSFVDVVMNDMTEEERKNIKVSKTGASRFAYAKVKILIGINKALKFFTRKISNFRKSQYLCTAIKQLRRLLGYGVMVTLQILVLPFLVRVRVAQRSQKRVCSS